MAGKEGNINDFITHVCVCIHSVLDLQLQPVAVLPTPSAWWDSDCPPLMASPSVQSHSWVRWDESFQDFRRKRINNI